ncbi:hypothetical protein K456DRAFT_1730882 [Colletotrichum gloeosporioides 23]|nr:hypothetical protein K456DRAFT_1730882 [Colletotrichum gloeosporioides 23]
MCLNLLRNPEKTRSWISKNPEGSYLRQLALDQLRELDRWAGEDFEDDLFNTRACYIFVTTMMLSEATEATRKGVLKTSKRSKEENQLAQASGVPLEYCGAMLQAIGQLLTNPAPTCRFETLLNR